MKFKYHIMYVIVILVLAIILILNSRVHSIAKSEIIYDTILIKVPSIPDTLRDTVSITKYKTQIKDSIVLQKIEVPIDVDTAKILADYYGKVYQYNTTHTDSSLYLSIDQDIFQNKILKTDLQYRILRPKTVINNYSFTRLDFGVDLKVGDKTDLIPNLGVTFKNNHGVRVGYGLYENSVLIGYRYSINLN